MNRAQLLQQLTRLETAVFPKRLPPDDHESIVHISGHLPVLLSAPHATVHRRNGRDKQEEGYTSALARHVAARTGAHVLYTRYLSASDPNYDPETPYKRRLARVARQHDIRFVLDIHGMSNRYNFGLALGTMNGRSCPLHEPELVTVLQAHGFRSTTATQARQFRRMRWDRFVVNHPRFTGGLTGHTITRYASRSLGVPAAQLELCASLRVVVGTNGDGKVVFRGSEAGIETAVCALVDLVQTVAR